MIFLRFRGRWRPLYDQLVTRICENVNFWWKIIKIQAQNWIFWKVKDIFENPDLHLIREWSSEVVNSKKYVYVLYQKSSNRLCGHVQSPRCLHTLRIVAVQSVCNKWKSFTFQKIRYLAWISIGFPIVNPWFGREKMDFSYQLWVWMVS